MKITTLIAELEAKRAEHGDIEVRGFWDDCSWGIGDIRLARTGENSGPGVDAEDEAIPVLLIDVS